MRSSGPGRGCPGGGRDGEQTWGDRVRQWDTVGELWPAGSQGCLWGAPPCSLVLRHLHFIALIPHFLVLSTLTHAVAKAALQQPQVCLVVADRPQRCQAAARNHGGSSGHKCSARLLEIGVASAGPDPSVERLCDRLRVGGAGGGAAGSSGVVGVVEVDGVAGGKHQPRGGMGLVCTLKRLLKEYRQICLPKL